MPGRRAWSPSRFALDLAVGLAIAVPGILILGLLALPLSARWILGLEMALMAVFLFFRSRRPQARIPSELLDRSRLTDFSALVFGASFLAAAVKWLRVPLWSFDHFAIWGMKARKIVQDGVLDLGFLRLNSLTYANADYPLGLPLSWRALSLARPEEILFKSTHAIFGLALALLVRRIALRVSGSSPLANTMAAFLCVSPLFWDTEAMGLAELPLAFFAVASVALLLEARDGRAPVWVAGATIGFVSWVKKEGLLLSLLLLAFGAFLVLRGARSGRRAVRLAGLGLPALFLGFASLLIAWRLLPAGLSFFLGEWRGRSQLRLRHPGKIIAALGDELVRGDWWGIWFLFAVVFLYSLLTRRMLPSFLLGIVLAMLASYAAVYFFTYMDPLEHIQHSFFRVAAALVPLGTIGVSSVFERDRPRPGIPGP
jgi:hypothetical protein